MTNKMDFLLYSAVWPGLFVLKKEKEKEKVIKIKIKDTAIPNHSNFPQDPKYLQSREPDLFSTQDAVRNWNTGG